MARSKRKNPPYVAIIGAGYWGKNLVRNFHSLCTLKLVCDKNEAVLSNLKNQYDGIEKMKIRRVGNIMIDSFVMLRNKIENENYLHQIGVEPEGYALVTLHRPSN